MNDERLYAEVVQELRLRGPIAGLWAKAYAEANGNESQAKALYLRYRVKQLTQAEHEVIVESKRHRQNNDLDNLYAEVRSNLSKHAPFLIGILILFVVLLIAILTGF